MNKALRALILTVLATGCVGQLDDGTSGDIGTALVEIQPKEGDGDMDEVGATSAALRNRRDAATPMNACGGLDYLGRCAGTVSEWCEGGAIRRRDCARSGLSCGYIDSRIGWYCKAAPDAGAPRDAGTPDAGAPRDGGTILDAGVSIDASTPPTTSGCGTALEQAELALTNEARAAQGLGALVCDEALTRAARLHSQDMCTLGYFAHESLDGRKFTDRIRAQGATYGWAGENIAWGYRTPNDVHVGWMNSEGHKANILGTRYRRVGIGQVDCNGRPYWTQDFTD